MDQKETAMKHYAQLAEKYPIQSRFENTLTQIQDILEEMGILKQVVVNTHLLGSAILSYFEDIDRLKQFEGIERTNVAKIYAYETFWLLRNKPIQIIDSSITMNNLHINEKVFAAILICKMCSESGRKFDDTNPRMPSFLNLLYYNFKYRLFTQQSLELMISAFFLGSNFK